MLLFNQKLEYDYRLCEQELYLVRLSLSILFQKDMLLNKGESQRSLEDLSEKVQQLDVQKEVLLGYQKKLEE